MMIRASQARSDQQRESSAGGDYRPGFRSDKRGPPAAAD
jgi:hypothetical protein